MKIRLLELFGGIGAFTKALQRIDFDVHVVDYVEIDKYAVASYNAIHDTNFEPQDIKKWDKNIEVDIITHGSPCQDFSLAGLQLGASRGGQTRSSLMYETVRIVKKLKPQYVIWENVPNVLSKKHIHNFQNYIQFLDNLGYKSAYEVLNAKDYGIPQNRERLFVVSVLNGRTRDLLGLELYFDFPQPIQLKLKLKDMLENDVDEKYYLSDKMIHYLTTEVSGKFPRKKRFEQSLKTTNKKDISTTITTNPGNKPTDNFIVIKNNTKKGYLKAEEGDGVNISTRMHHHRGTVQKKICHTIDTDGGNTKGVVCKKLINNRQELTIRKLTPKECWRLMGFDDEDFKKAKKVNSDTQLYKQAGNSIVINVLEAIFKELFKL